MRKENVFSEEVTDADMDIIQKRVALQQRQFAEFEKRDKARKYQKIKAIYDYLTFEEVDEMLNDCSNDEVLHDCVDVNAWNAYSYACLHYRKK